MRVIRVRKFGGPAVLKLEDAPAPTPAAGQVVIDVEVAAVLFGDTIVRSGRFPFPLPYTPGLEVGGQVAAVGPGVDGALLGRRVVATTPKTGGGYAQQAVVDARQLVEIPDGLDLDQAVPVFQAGAVALGMLSAMRVTAEETVLVTAAAGRIGSLLVQAAKAAGATVIGAVGSTAKAQFAATLGVDAVVDYSNPDWIERVKAASGGRGVDVALDAIGGQIGAGALSALRDGAGRLGTYGFASGEWTPLDAGVLGRRGLTVVGAAGVTFAKPEAEQRADTERALSELAAGRLKPRVHAVLPLHDAPRAHTELEERRNVGAILLKP
jgi:NADPH2:quinone reductase